MTATLAPHLTAALTDMQRYLQDDIPPDAAVGSIATLLAQPPEVLMQRVAAWSNEKALQDSASVGDLLLHSLKKVYIVGEMGLLDREAIAGYLDRATTLALKVCPTDCRDALRSDLAAMRASRATSMRVERPVIEIPIMQPVRSKEEEEDERLAKRFALVFERLTRQMQAGTSGGTAPDAQSLAQLFTMAADRAQTGQQLSSYLEQLKPLAGGKEGNVFVILGGGLPSWDIPDLGPGVQRKPPAQVGAMEKIIDLSESRDVATARFRDLVIAAVGKFNEGSLAATIWMLDVALDTITEKKLDPTQADRIRNDAAENIDPVQLRKYAETKSKHAALRIALEFFPSLRLDMLFKRLRGEQRREKRRLLLGFLEAYAVPAREMAITELEHEEKRPDLDTYYQRNLIYLLHRINRESDESVGRELQALGSSSARGQNIYVVKEAATAIGQIRTDDAVKLLTLRLAEYEALLLRNDTTYGPIDELQKLLDRIIAGLARIGTTDALLTIARHGMKANPQLGDTRARLAVLAQHDLSFDQATVTILMNALKEDIPGKLFGRLIPKRPESTIHLISALSGTRSDDVIAMMQDIADRFADQELGNAAAEVVRKWMPAAARIEAAPTLAGELEFFGLPSVMQSLADMRATGFLTLKSRAGLPMAKLAFFEGKFVDARLNHLKGIDAVYELLERPASGSFAFVAQPPDKLSAVETRHEVVHLILEGVRRNDELQQLTAVVPDQMTAVKTNVTPTPHDEEEDPALVRDVWQKIVSGAMVGDIEREIATDSYRIRRLIAHWLEQGSLRAA